MLHIPRCCCVCAAVPCRTELPWELLASAVCMRVCLGFGLNFCFFIVQSPSCTFKHLSLLKPELVLEILLLILLLFFLFVLNTKNNGENDKLGVKYL